MLNAEDGHVKLLNLPQLAETLVKTADMILVHRVAHRHVKLLVPMTITLVVILRLFTFQVNILFHIIFHVKKETRTILSYLE